MVEIAKVRSLPEVAPRDVPGYAAAVAAGTVRPVPRTPPRLVEGATAQRRFHLFLLQGAAVVAGVLLMLEVVPRLGVGVVATSVVVLVVGLLGFGALLWLWGRVGARNLEELARGYTTFRMQFGGFWWGEGRRWEQVHHRAPWDYSGVWVLDGEGRVVASPAAGVDGPGLYPSPNRPGSFELWSGVVWTGQYRRPEGAS